MKSEEEECQTGGEGRKGRMRKTGKTGKKGLGPDGFGMVSPRLILSQSN